MTAWFPLKQSPFPTLRNKQAARMEIRARPICLHLACQISEVIPGWTPCDAAACVAHPALSLPPAAAAEPSGSCGADYVDLKLKPTRYIEELGEPMAMRVRVAHSLPHRASVIEVYAQDEQIVPAASAHTVSYECLPAASDDSDGGMLCAPCAPALTAPAQRAFLIRSADDDWAVLRGAAPLLCRTALLCVAPVQDMRDYGLCCPGLRCA